MAFINDVIQLQGYCHLLYCRTFIWVITVVQLVILIFGMLRFATQEYDSISMSCGIVIVS
jgi:hypothetical protein